MAGELSVDLGDVSELHQSLSDLVNDLAGISVQANNMADAVGSPKLGEQTRQFSENWKHRREDLVEYLTSARDVIGAIKDTFESVDSELTKGLSD